jgi:hypothetical protein
MIEIALLEPNVDAWLDRMQSDLPEDLKHLKLFATRFAGLHNSLVNAFGEYAKMVIRESTDNLVHGPL